jgi:hypothetical protein
MSPEPLRTAPFHLDLDVLEPAEKVIAPFTVTLGGKCYILIDAREIDYRDIRAAQRAYLAGDYEPSIRLVISKDDADGFFANQISPLTLKTMFSAYNSHYDLRPPKQEVTDA